MPRDVGVEKIGILSVSISQLFSLILRGWGVCSGCGKYEWEMYGFGCVRFFREMLCFFLLALSRVFGLRKDFLWVGADDRDSLDIWSPGWTVM